VQDIQASDSLQEMQFYEVRNIWKSLMGSGGLNWPLGDDIKVWTVFKWLKMRVHWVVFVNVVTGILVHKYREFLNWFSNYQICGKFLSHIPIYIRQDATLHSLFISWNCSTCFRWYLHPSSGAHTSVSTASGICQTDTATCRYRGRVGTGSSSSTIAAYSSNGVINTTAVSRYNKLCNIASCWIYILEYSYDARTHKH
jgi:hypothetical protein